MSEVPDCLFPSSNDDGIPDLSINMQGDYVDQPLAYGSVKRNGDYRGRLLHHYVDDARFNALGNAVEYGAAFRQLWERPQRIVDSHCPSMCEINFSTLITIQEREQPGRSTRRDGFLGGSKRMEFEFSQI